VAYRGGVRGVHPPPRNFKVLAKLSQIPSSVENTSVTTFKSTSFTHLQIERNPWLGGYCPQIPVLSALCLQLNLLNPPRTKFLDMPLSTANIITHYLTKAWATYFFFKLARLVLGPTTASNSVVSWGLCKESSSHCMRLTTHHHLMSRWSVSGVTHQSSKWLLSGSFSSDLLCFPQGGWPQEGL
jgi:hypothetical protein